MSSKFNLKELRKSRTLLESNQAKEVLSSETDSQETLGQSTNSTIIGNSPTQSSAGMQKRGRPAVGKRSDPDYITALAYVRKDTYDEVRNRLFPERREYSDLIQELLEQWLKSNN
jgi:hypothetical protein